MSQSRKSLALTATVAALKLRKQLKISLDSPINVFDVCERLGVSVFFQDIPSMEGIYMPDASPRSVILISSLRPAGRQAMTCGHELGHHVFKHGKQWDELVEERTESRRFQPEEFLVDVFSAALQMPKLAVSHAFAERELDPRSCEPEKIYAMSNLFGVSYAGFVFHLEKTLNLIDSQRASLLNKHSPKSLRQSIVGRVCPENLIVVDQKWSEKTIDLEVGDSAVLPPEVDLEGNNVAVSSDDSHRTVVSAATPGIAKVSNAAGWNSFIRVSRSKYVGRAPFRFDPEVYDAV